MINRNEGGRVYVCDDCKTAIKTFVSMRAARNAAIAHTAHPDTATPENTDLKS